MNSVLLSIGVAIVLALFAVLIGPFFIDWNQHKAMLESRIEQVIGLDVELEGNIEGRILPVPVFEISDARVLGPGGDKERPVLVVPRMQLSVALTPLLKGLVRVTEVELVKPVLQLGLRGDGSVIWGGVVRQASVSAEDILVDALTVRDGSVTLTNARGERVTRLTAVNITGTASSLAGPFKAEGGARHGEDLYAFRLGTGRLQPNGEIRTKFSLTPASNMFELSADGRLTVAEGRPGFAGTISLGHLPPPADAEPATDPSGQLVWRLTGEIEANADAATLGKARLAIGPEARAVTILGEARADLSPAVKVTVSATTRQVDLDRAFANSGSQEIAGAKMPVAAAGGALGGLLHHFSRLPESSRIDFAADAAVLNGGLIEELSGEILVQRAGLRIGDLRMRLPGSSRLRAAGEVTFADGVPQFDISTEFASRHLAVLSEWAQIGASGLGPLALRPGAVALEGTARLTSDTQGLALDDLDVRLDESRLGGRIAVTTDALDVQLKVDSVDLDRYFDIAARKAAEDESARPSGAIVRGMREAKIKLDVERASIRDVTARDISADVSYEGGTLAVNRLQIADLAGTSLKAGGTVLNFMGEATGDLSAELESADLTALAGLAADLGFDMVPRAKLLEQASALSPAALTFLLDAGSKAQARSEASLQGRLGGSALEATFVLDGQLGDIAAGRIEAGVTVANQDAANLLRQFGFAQAVAAHKKRGGTFGDGSSFEVSVSGIPQKGADVALSARLLGLDTELAGTWTPQDGRHGFAGEVKLLSVDARDALAFLGLPAPVSRKNSAAELSARATLENGHWTLADVKGHAGANTFAGHMQIAPPKVGGAVPELSGELSLDNVSLGWLSAALLGGDSTADDAKKSGADDVIWPQRPFSLNRAPGVAGKVKIITNRFDLGAGMAAGGASFALAANGDTVTLEQFSGSLFGGTAYGEARLSWLPSGVALQADLALDHGVLADMVWRPAGTPVIEGHIGAKAQVSGEGRSWLGLVSSLTGEGSFNISEAVVRKLDPDAFAKIVRAADSGLELKEARVLSVFRGYLDAGSFRTEGTRGVFTISAGVLSARNVTLAGPEARAQVSAIVDLHEMGLDSEWAFAPVDGAGVRAAAGPGQAADIPAVTLSFAGPLHQPERRLDVSALIGYLTVRRLEKDVRKLEAAQADAIERERFDRLLVKYAHDHMRRVRQKREEERRAKEAAEQAKREEQRRLEEARRAEEARLEEERRRREEEQRRQEEARRAEQARLQEEARRAEEARLEEERRRQEEADRAEQTRLEEEARRAEEARKSLQRNPAPDTTGSTTGAPSSGSVDVRYTPFRSPQDQPAGDAVLSREDIERRQELDRLIKQALGDSEVKPEPPTPPAVPAARSIEQQPAPRPAPASPPAAQAQRNLPPPLELAPRPAAPVPAPAQQQTREPEATRERGWPGRFRDPAMPTP